MKKSEMFIFFSNRCESEKKDAAVFSLRNRRGSKFRPDRDRVEKERDNSVEERNRCFPEF